MGNHPRTFTDLGGMVLDNDACKGCRDSLDEGNYEGCGACSNYKLNESNSQLDHFLEEDLLYVENIIGEVARCELNHVGHDRGGIHPINVW